jgi:ribonuclease P protein component
MLKKSQRLSTKQFNEVMSRGRILHSPLFLARVLIGQNGAKISAAAPVKLFKKAVERNKIRRKIYDVLGSFARSLPAFRSKPPQSAETGAHIIIFAKGGVLEAGPEEMAADLKALFVKAGLLK